MKNFVYLFFLIITFSVSSDSNIYSQEISNAVALVNGKTEDRRTKLEDVYDMLFANSIWSEQIDPVEIIPFQYKLIDPLAIVETEIK